MDNFAQIGLYTFNIISQTHVPNEIIKISISYSKYGIDNYKRIAYEEESNGGNKSILCGKML